MKLKSGARPRKTLQYSHHSGKSEKRTLRSMHKEKIPSQQCIATEHKRRHLHQQKATRRYERTSMNHFQIQDFAWSTTVTYTRIHCAYGRTMLLTQNHSAKIIPTHLRHCCRHSTFPQLATANPWPCHGQPHESRLQTTFRSYCGGREKLPKPFLL